MKLRFGGSACLGGEVEARGSEGQGQPGLPKILSEENKPRAGEIAQW